jgi:hypothetical protein
MQNYRWEWWERTSETMAANIKFALYFGYALLNGYMHLLDGEVASGVSHAGA